MSERLDPEMAEAFLKGLREEMRLPEPDELFPKGQHWRDLGYALLCGVLFGGLPAAIIMFLFGPRVFG